MRRKETGAELEMGRGSSEAAAWNRSEVQCGQRHQLRRDPAEPLQNRKGSGALGLLAPGNTMEPLPVNSLEPKKRGADSQQPSRPFPIEPSSLTHLMAQGFPGAGPCFLSGLHDTTPSFLSFSRRKDYLSALKSIIGQINIRVS